MINIDNRAETTRERPDEFHSSLPQDGQIAEATIRLEVPLLITYADGTQGIMPEGALLPVVETSIEKENTEVVNIQKIGPWARRRNGRINGKTTQHGLLPNSRPAYTEEQPPSHTGSLPIFDYHNTFNGSR